MGGQRKAGCGVQPDAHEMIGPGRRCAARRWAGVESPEPDQTRQSSESSDGYRGLGVDEFEKSSRVEAAAIVLSAEIVLAFAGPGPRK